MAKKNEVKPAEKKQVATTESTETKAKQDHKKFPVRKLPRLLKKAYTPEAFQKKIIKNLYVPADIEDLNSLFVKGGNPKYPDKLAVPIDRKFTWIEIKDYKWTAKEIKQNRKGIIKVAPLIALISAIAALVIVVGIFKNPLAKKAIKSGCEAAFGAKTEVGSVDLKIFSASLTVKDLGIYIYKNNIIININFYENGFNNNSLVNENNGQSYTEKQSYIENILRL